MGVWCVRALSCGCAAEYCLEKVIPYLSLVLNCQKRAVEMAGDFEGNPFADQDGINPFAVRAGA